MTTLIIKHKLALAIAVLFLAFMGLARLSHLPVTLYPAVDKPSVRGRVYFKVDVAEFKNLWGTKIEKSLLAIEGVERVTSEYTPGLVTYFVNFDWEIRNDTALREVQSILSNYSAQLPRDLKPIQVGLYNPGTECYLVVKAPHASGLSLSEYLQSTLGPKLNEIPGVSRYWISAVDQEDVVIAIDPLLLAQYQLTMTDLVDTLNFRLYDKVIGVHQKGPRQQVYVKLENGAQTLTDIQNIVLRQSRSDIVRLADVATVSYQTQKITRELLLDGEPAVAVALWPHPDANLYTVANGFFDTVSTQLPAEFEIVVLNNPADFIRQALRKVGASVILAMLASSLLVLIFLRSVSRTLLIFSVLPLSVCGSVLVMEASGISINLLSVGAMSITAGMVIDSAIVVMDRLAESRSGEQAIGNAMTVAPAILASVITTIAVFVPLAFTEPMAATLLRDIAWVVTSLMLFSLVVSLVLIPVIWSGVKVFHLSAEAMNETSSGWGIRWYRQSLLGLIRSPVAQGLSMLLVAAVVVLSVWMVERTRVEIVAEPLPEIIDVGVHFRNPGLDAEARRQLAETVRVELAERYRDKLEVIYSDIREDIAYLSLHLKTYRSAPQLMIELNRTLEDTDDYRLTVDPWVTSSLKIPDPADLQVLVSGDTEQERRENLADIQRLLKAAAGIRKIRTNPSDQQIETNLVSVDRRMLNSLVPTQEIDTVVNDIALYGGAYTERKLLAQTDLDDRSRQIYYQVSHEEFSRLEDLPYIRNGELFHLGDLFNVEQTTDWKTFYHRNGIPLYEASVWLEHNSPAAVEQVKQILRTGLTEAQADKISFGNTREEVDAGLRSLMAAFALSLALTLLILAFMFSNFAQALIVALSIPAAVAGALITLYLFNSTLSLNSLIGMVMLCGMAVNNGILFVDAYRTISHPAASSLDERIADSGARRLRAIAITTLSSVVGLMPIVAGLGAGGKILQPLGISLAGGLLVSVLFSLYIIPLLIYRFAAKAPRAVEYAYDA